MSRAAVACGADGVMMEVHAHPEHALCDGDQSETPEMFFQVVSELRKIAEAVGRTV